MLQQPSLFDLEPKCGFPEDADGDGDEDGSDLSTEEDAEAGIVKLFDRVG